MSAITNGSCLQHLIYLLEFLAAWEQRPTCLTPMAYQWCSAISESAGRPRQGEPTRIQEGIERAQRRLRQLRQQPGLPDPRSHTGRMIERGFSEVGPGCDLVRLNGTSHRARWHPQYLTRYTYAGVLSTTLEIGFRPGLGQSTFYLDHTSNHNWVFETAFSSRNDNAIADAASAWIAGGDRMRPCLYARYLAERVERDYPFSSRLRLMCIRVIERTWPGELEVDSALEVVRLLNRLDVDVDDLEDPCRWSQLLIKTIRSTTEPRGLSSHYWRLLGKLVSRHGAIFPSWEADFVSRSAEVTRSLEEAEDWERLEVWMVIAWLGGPTELMEEVGRVTLKLLLRRPSALQNFDQVQYDKRLYGTRDAELRRICNLGRTGQLLSESPPL